MRPRRLGIAVLAFAAAALAAALPAAAKEGTKATLLAPIPLDAAPGTKLEVAWRLFYVDESGRRQPFGASGVFVRLHSASGAAAEEAFAPQHAGEFSATVVVPDGGIGDVEIGLMGWRSDAAGSERADVVFPITNEPRPGAASGGAEAGTSAWTIAAAGTLALAVLAGAFLVARAQRSRRTLAAKIS